jgi:hypothetical protein
MISVPDIITSWLPQEISFDGPFKHNLNGTQSKTDSLWLTVQACSTSTELKDPGPGRYRVTMNSRGTPTVWDE